MGHRVVCILGKAEVELLRLSEDGARHWYELFIILSLERADPYLQEIGFPIARKGAEVGRIARDFVLSCHEIQLQSYRSYYHPPWQETVETQSLFDRTYDTLVKALGRENADLICNWGNQLQIGATIRHSLEIHERLLYSLVQKDSASDLTPLVLPDEILKWLVSTIREYGERSRETGLALDALDESAKSDWENQVSTIVNYLVESDGGPPLSSYNELHTLINDIRCQQLLTVIESRLSKEQLEILEKWLQSQPLWVRDQARPAHYYRSIGLTKLLGMI